MILPRRRSPVEDIFKISFTLSAIKECFLWLSHPGWWEEKSWSMLQPLYRNFPVLTITTPEINKQDKINQPKVQTKTRPYGYWGADISYTWFYIMWVKKSLLLANMPLTEYWGGVLFCYSCWIYWTCLSKGYVLSQWELDSSVPTPFPGSWGCGTPWQTRSQFLR